MLPYDPHLRKLAVELRKNSTIAEILLWQHLQKGQRLGYGFRRQRPISHWIADFFSAELKLVVEIDGDSHRFRAAEDARKDAAFRELGLTVLRFGDTRMKTDAAGVAASIDAWILANRSRGTLEIWQSSDGGAA